MLVLGFVTCAVLLLGMQSLLCADCDLMHLRIRHGFFARSLLSVEDVIAAWL